MRRAATADDVAEPHRHERSAGAPGAGGGEALGDALGVAEHVLGVGGLVGADVDDPVDPMAFRRPRGRCAVPRTLVFHPSLGAPSSAGTCLSAAAWNTSCGRWRAKTSSSRSASRMSAITGMQQRASFDGSECMTWWSSESSWSSAISDARFEFGELADELGADRAAGAGDEHAASGDEVAHGGGVDVDDPAIEDVLVGVPGELSGGFLRPRGAAPVA